MELTRNHWTYSDYKEFKDYLSKLADAKYKKFSDSLVPDGNESFGVRIPILRSAAKSILKGNYTEFIACNIGDYREEILVWGMVMSRIKCPYSQMISYIRQYADKIISWETCDTVTFKYIKNHITEFFCDVESLIFSKNPWHIRYGFLCLMKFYLNDEYIDRVLDYVSRTDSDFYYVRMMQAWLIAEAAVKVRDKAMDFLAAKKLNAATQNMAIQKIRDSYRISAEDKAYARSLKKHP